MSSTPKDPAELLLDYALQKVGSTPLTTQLLLQLSADLGQIINRWSGLKGPEKAALVLGTLAKLLEQPAIREKLTDDQIKALRVIIDTVIPETLTLLVAAGRGEIDFRKPTPGCFAAFCRSGVAIAVASVAAAENEKGREKKVTVV